MDTKRRSDENYFGQLRDLYANKYRFLVFDVIVSSDDHALNLLLKYRDELFPGVPVVFSGINDCHPSRIAGHEFFSGAEPVNITTNPLKMYTCNQSLDRLHKKSCN